jgi:hypothetical protein
MSCSSIEVRYVFSRHVERFEKGISTWFPGPLSAVVAKMPTVLTTDPVVALSVRLHVDLRLLAWVVLYTCSDDDFVDATTSWPLEKSIEADEAILAIWQKLRDFVCHQSPLSFPSRFCCHGFSPLKETPGGEVMGPAAWVEIKRGLLQN